MYPAFSELFFDIDLFQNGNQERQQDNNYTSIMIVFTYIPVLNTVERKNKNDNKSYQSTRMYQIPNMTVAHNVD